MSPESTPEAVTLRDGFDARLVLSYGAMPRTLYRSIQVLELGCGGGEDLLNTAALQPGVLFTGVTADAVACGKLREEAREQELTNVEVQMVDPMDPTAIDLPEEGFDLVRIAGIPAGIEAGAAGLGAWLRAASACLTPAGLLTLELPAGEGEHTVARLFAAIEEAGLVFLRWHDRAAWAPESLDLREDELAVLKAAPAPERFAAIEALRAPERLSLVLARPGNGPRASFELTRAGETHFMVHPEVTFHVTSRNAWGVAHFDHLAVQRGVEEPVVVRPGAVRDALFMLREQREPFSGLGLVDALVQRGATLDEALMVIHQLVSLEVIYAPHEFDVAQFYASSMARATEAAETPEGIERVVRPMPAPRQGTAPSNTPSTPKAKAS